MSDEYNRCSSWPFVLLFAIFGIIVVSFTYLTSDKTKMARAQTSTSITTTNNTAFPTKLPTKIGNDEFVNGMTYWVIATIDVNGTKISEIEEPSGETHLTSNWDVVRFETGTYFKAMREAPVWKFKALPKDEVSRNIRDYDCFYFPWP